MNFKQILIILLIVSIGFLTYPVNADSGSSTITDIVTKNGYTVAANLGTAGTNIKYLKVDNTDYNSVFTFTAYFPGGATFSKEFSSDTFTITGGGTGSGAVSYNKTDKRIYWYFQDVVFSSNHVTLTYSNDIQNEVTFDAGQLANGAFDIGVDRPIGITNNAWTLIGNANGVGGNNVVYNVNMGIVSNYNWAVTYPVIAGTQFFDMQITKFSGVQNNVRVKSFSTDYCYNAGVYDTTSFSCLKPYADGLYLNGSVSSGAYELVTINTTGSGELPPPPTPTPNADGVGIIFDQQTYSVNDIANISWIRTIDTPLLCTDYVSLQTPENKYDLVVSPSDSGYVKELVNIIGEYQTSFERVCFLGGTTVLDYDFASVEINEQASYIYSPAQVGVGQLFNVTYFIGWTKTTGSTVWLRDYYWDNTTNAYSSTYQPWALIGSKGVETNQSILVTKTGKHLLKICDVLLGCKASTTLEAYFNGSEVTTNVSVSNITIDKSSYSYGETILVKTAIDNFNWSNKQIVVEYENYGQALVQNQQYIQSQIESFPLYISDLTFTGSGISRLRLTGKNSSGNYILAYVNFTLSSVDSEGYGLSILGDSSCINDIAQINVIVPAGEVGNLTISADNVKYNKAYTINGTKTISYKYLIEGTYYITLSVNGEAKRNIIKVISSTGSCIIPIPTVTYKGINGTWTATNENIKETCAYWDTWVRGIFGVQGVNDITRILFALGAIVAMMFVGLIASKGNFGVAVILGFFPYAFFTYITFSSPCGQYMPLWINIFIALIIGIKMKWFS